MKRIMKLFFLTLGMLLVTILLVLGPTVIVGITARIISLPDFLGIPLVLSVFVASIATVLSEPYSLYWEQRFSSSGCFQDL